MTTQADNVRVGISGEISVAATTTTAPTTSTSALDAAFVGLGYISEDGVTEEYSDTVEDIVAWQNATVVRSTTTESKATLAFTVIETKGEVLELFHKGSTVEVVSAGQWKIDVLAPTADPRSFVLDVLDGTKHIRIYVANGEVSDRGAIVYANGEPVGYEMTVTAYPVNGVVLTKYSDDASWGYS
jgi:hypothetical protein